MMKKKNKPIPEAKDAKEVAKKLIRSGAIAAIQKSVEKEAKAKAEKSTGFKRSQARILYVFITKDSPSWSKVVNTVAPQIGYSNGYQEQQSS